jgi:pilus assembly protein CpaE
VTVRPRILVLDRRGELAGRLRSAFPGDDRPEIVHLSRTTQALVALHEEGPWDAIVAGPSEEHLAGLRRLAAVRAAAPDVGLLVTVNGTEPADLSVLVKARPDELVRVPAGRAQLRAAVEATLRAAAARRGDHGERVIVLDRPLARTVAVSGPTGGCGKTTIAVNLAALLAAGGKRVVLVDLDLQFGEVSAALGLAPGGSIYDVCYDEADRPLDDAALAEALADALVRVPAGFDVLPAPRDPAQADAIGPDEVARVLAALRARADEVVVDTATGLHDVGLVALDLADHVIGVSQVDVPGVANLRSYLATLDRLGVAAERRTVVLNKDMPDSGVTAADAVAVLGPVAGALPFSAGAVRALNAGRPLCDAAPDDPAARALRAALSPLLGHEVAVEPAPTRRRWALRRTK